MRGLPVCNWEVVKEFSSGCYVLSVRSSCSCQMGLYLVFVGLSPGFCMVCRLIDCLVVICLSYGCHVDVMLLSCLLFNVLEQRTYIGWAFAKHL